MNKPLIIAVLIALPIGLSGCEKKAETPTAEASTTAASSSAMPGTAMPDDTQMGAATGTVTALDAVAGKITLDHGAIPAVGWQAMTMGFSAKPELLAGLAVGDKVDFKVTVTGGSGEVILIEKQ